MRRFAASLLLLLTNTVVWAAPAPAVDPATEYTARAEKLGEKDAKGWLKLADFCEDHLLWDKRMEALHKVIAGAPDNAEAHARLDEVKRGKDWVPAEEAEAKEAEEKEAKGMTFYGKGWIAAKETEKLRQADSKTVGWDVRMRMDTPHLMVYSARPLAFTRRLAALLENEFDAYRRFYGQALKLPPNPPTFRVYVFADHDTFSKVIHASCNPPSEEVTGLYSSGTQILYVGTRKTPDTGIDELAETLGCATHEFNHAMDNMMARLHSDPIWLWEGRADYFGCSVRGRQLLPGATNPSWNRNSDLQKAVPSVGIGELMDMDKAKFMDGNASKHYALAWGWVHFLFHGEGGKYAERFRTFLKGLPGKGSKADFERAVGKLSELEPLFKSYVETDMQPPSTP